MDAEFDASDDGFEEAGREAEDESDEDDEDGEDFNGSDDVMGPLDLFAAEDDDAKIGILKKIFPLSERQSFIDIYKEEEASLSELHTESEFGDDYYLLKYIKNHSELLADKEEEVAEALGMD